MLQLEETTEDAELKVQKDNFRHTCKFYISQRYILCFMAFIGLTNVSFLRNHVTVTLLAMVNNTNINSTDIPQGNLNWDSIQQGHFLGAYFYGYFIGNLPGGIVAKRIGFKNAFSISVFMSAVVDFFVPLSAPHSFLLAVAFRAIAGFIQGTSLPAAISMWSKWAPPLERSFLVSITLSGILFGCIIILPVAGILVKYIDWKYIFYLTNGLSILWAILFFFFMTETPDTNPRISEEEKMLILEGQRQSRGSSKKKASIPWKAIFTSKCVIALMANHFSDAWYQLTYGAILPTYMVYALNYDTAQAGASMMLLFILQFVVAIIVGRMSDLVRKKWSVSITFIRKFNTCVGVSTAGILGAISGYGGENGSVVMIIFGIGFAISGSTYSGYLANSLDIGPDYSSVIMGISNTVACTSGFIGPLTTAYIVTDKTSRAQWQTSFWITCGLCCLGSFIFAIFGSGVQQKWSISPDFDDEKKRESFEDETPDENETTSERYNEETVNFVEERC